MKGDSSTANVKSGGGGNGNLPPGAENDPGLRYLIVDRNVVNDPLTQNEWTQKRLVWVPSAEAGFVQGGIKVKHFCHLSFISRIN